LGFGGFSLGLFLFLSLLGGFFLLGGSNFGFLLFLLEESHLLEFLVDSLLLSDGVLRSSGVLLGLQLLLSDLFLLHLVDGFNQNTLVLELVTLGGQVEVMIAIIK
jgi:hypothetical protein